MILNHRDLCSLLLLQIIATFVVASNVGIPKRKLKRQSDTRVESKHGFQMFSMMDFPHKSLERYSLDPVQSLIYSKEDLGQINGILTDRDVIEDPTAIGIKQTESSNKEESNDISGNEPNTRKFVQSHRNFLNMEKIVGKHITNLKQRQMQDSTKKVSDSRNSLRGKYDDSSFPKIHASTMAASTKKPPSTREQLSNRLIKSPGRRNFPIKRNSETGRIRAILRRIKDSPSSYHGQPKRNSLRDIQRAVEVKNYDLKPKVHKQKVSRSPPDIGRKIDEMIENQLKSLKHTRNTPVRSVLRPNERDFFFFKDAFEYGTRLLSQKLSKIKTNEVKLDGIVFTETPGELPVQMKNDLEKIKAEVEENLIKDTLKEKDSETNSKVHQVKNKEKKKQNSRPTGLKNIISEESNNKNGNDNSKKHTATSLSENVTTIRPLVNELNNSTLLNIIKNLENETKHNNVNKTDATVRFETESHTNIAKTGFSTTAKPLDRTITTTKSSQTLIEKHTSTRKQQSSLAHQSTKNLLVRNDWKVAKRNPSAPTGKVTVDAVKSTTRKRIKNTVKKDRPTIPVSGLIRTEKVFPIPDWKLPPFFVRRSCPSKADAMFNSHNNKVYAIDGNMVYIIGSHGVEVGPLPLQFVWPEVQTPINDGYVRSMDRMLFLFFKNRYAAYLNDRELVGEPSEITAIGLPRELAPMDAVSSWTGNRRTYYFKDSYYWRYNDWQNRIDTGYPKPIKRHWQKVPDNVDTAFIAPNSYLYFVKGGLIYKMNFYKASVQYRYPKKLSESCYDFFM